LVRRRSTGQATALRARHEYELYLAIEDIDHSRTKTKSPQTTVSIRDIFLLCTGDRAAARCKVKSLPRSLYRRSSLAAPVRAFGTGLILRGVQSATKWA
jgi:hypothetical protein